MTRPTARPPPLLWRLLNAHGQWPACLVVIVVPILVLFALRPTTNNEREWKRRRTCATHLRHIGRAVDAYCRDHADSYPDAWATLVREVPDLSPEDLCCPNDDETPAAGGSRAAVAAAVAAGGHCSYVYLGRGLTRATAPASTVIAYEPVTPSTGHEDGVNLLWADGTVDWHDTADAVKLLPAAATRPAVRFGRPIVEIR